MPIRAENRGRYPKNWKAISHRIRFDRAAGRCECVGDCGLPHDGRCDAVHREPHPVTGSIVLLTVAHLDHTPEHCDEANLKAMCQRCHLVLDHAQHQVNAARTRWLAKTAGMDPLF